MAVLVKLNGVASSGPTTLTDTPYITTGTIIYVDSVTGADANAGTREEKPKATVFGASGALTAATDGASDLIVCLSTHRETISAAAFWTTTGLTAGVDLTNLSMVGRGTGTSRPQFTSAVAGVGLTVRAVGSRIENCYFVASTAATTSRITFTSTATGGEIKDCYFECGATDDDCIIVNAATDNRIEGTTFKATAAPASGTAQRAIRFTGAAVRGMVRSCIVDGGSVGWTGNAIGGDSATADGFRIQKLTLSNYTKLVFSTAGAKGYISGVTSDTTSAFSWTE